MKLIIKGGRIELIPEEEIDRDRLAQIPEGTNTAFVYTTLDGGEDGCQEALVVYIGPIPLGRRDPQDFKGRTGGFVMSACARAYSDRLKQMHDRRAKICEPCEFKSRDECLGWYWPDISCPKALEIWGEKPPILTNVGTHEVGINPKFVGWLEKLKAHIDWLASYINANQLIVNQFAYHDEKYWWKGDDLGKMKEKAELWEQYAIYDNDKEAEIPVKDLLIAYEELGGYKADAVRMCAKLRAIEAWFDSEKGYQTPGLEDLGKLLEGS